MKKNISLCALCFVISGLFLMSCKKVDLKELEYQHITRGEYLQAYVKKKGGGMVLWFQVFDQMDNTSDFKKAKFTSDTIGSYPAKINEDKWIWLLVNDRIEIRLVAFSAVKDFQDTGKLKKFIASFDLAGMEKITGPKLKAADLEKFIPKLGGQ
ncbi:MAG: hypothetical protein JXA07_01730 [Spirochaetes bacterium]|nr:hypothetical protein [Spirochaetota bacterium]